MGEKALAAMSVEDYYVWGELQDERYEYVDGFPVLRSPEGGARLMAGASHRHDRIVLNCLLALGTRLRDRACQPFTSDTAVATSATRRRRPDVGVDCGRPRDRDYVAADPRVVIEVLSPSNREFDFFGKLEEYRALESLAHILVIEPNAAEARLWSRDADRTWSSISVQGIDGMVGLPAIDVELSMREVYDRLDFPPSPRLVTA